MAASAAPDPLLHPTKKVRVVAKIRGFTFTDMAADGLCVSVKGDGDASQTRISFGDQSSSRKECYELDFCYDQNQGNDFMFIKEVKPLISGLLRGCNATIIACGARATGKTRLIQGTIDEPGLAMLAMGEILQLATENGRSITISFYEIDQDHVYDLLNPKRQEVFVLKDGQGKIQLKGLSKVPVTSMSEFHKLYGDGNSFLRKPTQKTAIELPHRSHKGLIVYLSCQGENLGSFPPGKINFVDLAGYEDSRRKGSNGLNLVENSKINKSIYALQNVVYSLNANETHVPYRESKLTHMLQDSLGGASRILMVTCLNPFFCQDSIYMVSLASRCCQSTSRPVLDAAKKKNSSARQTASHKSQILRSVSNTARKQTVPQIHFSGKKMNCTSSSLKARKLFDETDHLKAEKPSHHPDIVSTTKFSLQEEGQLMLNVAKVAVPLEEDASLIVSEDVNSVSMVLQETSPLTVSNAREPALPIKDVFLHREGNHEEVTASTEVLSMFEEASPLAVSTATEPALPIKDVFLHREGNHEEVTASTEVLSMFEEASPLAVSNATEPALPIKDVFLHREGNHEEVTASTEVLSMFEGKNLDKENNSSQVNEGGSPPISARLQELSNNLKSLYFSTPSYKEMAAKNDNFHSQTSTNFVEPKTPDQSINLNDREVASFYSPWETFSTRSAGMKKSIVQEHLRLLNTAGKEELKKLKWIGEKRATYILELREESPEPFKSLDDLKDIGLSAKQIKEMVSKEVAELLN